MKHVYQVYPYVLSSFKRALLPLCCAFVTLHLVGCGFVGGWNPNEQKPGGDPSQPTDLTGGLRPGNNSTDGADGQGGGSLGHARLALSKDGRFVLFTRTDDKGDPNYQPKFSRNGVVDSILEDMITTYLCTERFYEKDKDTKKLRKRKTPLDIKTSLWVLDIQENQLKELPITLELNRMQVLMHPDGKSFFLIKYGCDAKDGQYSTIDDKAYELVLKEIQQFKLPSFKKGIVLRGDSDILQGTAKTRWLKVSARGDSDEPLPFPAKSKQVVMSPKGRFLGFARNTKTDDDGHQVYFLDLQDRKRRKVSLASPLLQIGFLPDESAAIAIGSKEFDTYQMRRDNDCRSNPDKPACQQYQGWIDISKLNLTAPPKLSNSGTILGYAVDGHLRLKNTAHGSGGRTKTLAFHPDGKRIIVDGCDDLNWKEGSCAGRLFVIDTTQMRLVKTVSALGPAGFTPDGSVLIGWDGTRNDLGQVLIPFPFTYDESKDGIRHKVVLFDTERWSEQRVDMPFYGPMFFVTPKGNFMVTVSTLEGDKIVVADLDQKKSVALKGQLSMAEFSVSSDGKTIYTVEKGGLKKLDLAAVTLTDILPEGKGVENVHVLPKSLQFPYKPQETKSLPNVSANPTPDAQPLKRLKKKLRKTPLSPYVASWKRNATTKPEGYKDAILVSRFGRTLFEIWSNDKQQLFHKQISYPKP